MNYNQALNTLGLTEGFTQEELKKRYRRLSATYHPDIAGDSSTAKFIEIKKAYEYLSVSRKISSKKSFTHQSIFNVVVRT